MAEAIVTGMATKGTDFGPVHCAKYSVTMQATSNAAATDRITSIGYVHHGTRRNACARSSGSRQSSSGKWLINQCMKMRPILHGMLRRVRPGGPQFDRGANSAGGVGLATPALTESRQF